jgi:hypothetical protein
MLLHSLSRLASRLSRSSSASRRAAKRKPARGGRLRLEALEDRTLPSVVNWVGGSGDWSNANNWLDATTQTHHTPTATDDAVINVDSVVVTHSSGSDKVRSLTSENSFVMSGGSLDLANASTLDSDFTFTNGTISGTGTLTVNGAFTWSGGTMMGSGHTRVNNTLALSNTGGFFNSTMLDGRALDNAGTTTWTGPGNISVGNGGSFNNLSGGTFNASTDTTASPSFTSFGTPGGAFNNAGTFNKQSTSGTSSISIAFNNSGTLDVQMGTLNLNNGGDSTGSFVVEAGATLAFNSGTHTLRAASSVSGAGTVQFGTTDFGGAGTINELGTYSVNTTNLVSSTVNFAHDSTLVNLNMSNGTLTGLNDVTVTGTLNWTGGTMSGAGRTISTGTLNISGNNSKTLDTRTLNNSASATWTGTDIGVVNGAVFNNLAAGSFDDQTSANFGGVFGSSGTFNNAGTFTKSQTSDQTTINVAFNNSGSAEVQDGTLRLTNGTSSGSFTTDAGMTLAFTGNQTLTVASSLDGPGKVLFSSGTSNVLGSFAPGGTVTVSGGTVNFGSSVDLGALTFTSGTITGSGTVTVEGTVNWTGGTMSGSGSTVTNDTVNVSNPSFFGPTLDGRTFVNNGTFVFTGTGGFSVANGAVFNNSGTFLYQTNAQLSGSGGAVFNNTGDFQKNSSSGTSIVNFTFNNDGTLEVQTGTLNFSSSGESSGSISVSAGAVLLFNGSGIFTMHSSSSVDGNGTVQFGTSDFFSTSNAVITGSYTVAKTDIVNTGNGTINFASDETINTLTLEGGTLTGTGNVTVTNLFNWTGGAMTGVGSTISTGTFNVSGNNGKDLNGRELDNTGTLTWTGTGSITVRNGGLLDNQLGGTFLIQNDTSLSGGSTFFDTAGKFTNEGTLRKQSSSGTTSVGVPFTNSIPFTNSGTVDIQSGTISFSGTYTQTDGGSTTLATGTTLTASGGVSLQGGTLSGTGTINGNVVNSGAVVSVGTSTTTGILKITGSYTQTETGTLAIKLGGTTAGTGYDQLQVTGATTLDGTLTVTLINGFNPALNNTFNILTFGSHTGDFATENFPALSGGLVFVPSFSATALILTVAMGS